MWKLFSELIFWYFLDFGLCKCALNTNRHTLRAKVTLINILRLRWLILLSLIDDLLFLIHLDMWSWDRWIFIVLPMKVVAKCITVENKQFIFGLEFSNTWINNFILEFNIVIDGLAEMRSVRLSRLSGMIE